MRRYIRLFTLKWTKDVNRITCMLDDTDAGVRAAAKAVLDGLLAKDPQQQMSIAKRFYDSAIDDIRCWARSRYKALKVAEVMALKDQGKLVVALQDSDSDVRQAVMKTLEAEGMGARENADVFDVALNNVNEDVRVWAVKSIRDGKTLLEAIAATHRERKLFQFDPSKVVRAAVREQFDLLLTDPEQQRANIREFLSTPFEDNEAWAEPKFRLLQERYIMTLADVEVVLHLFKKHWLPKWEFEALSRRIDVLAPTRERKMPIVMRCYIPRTDPHRNLSGSADSPSFEARDWADAQYSLLKSEEVWASQDVEIIAQSLGSSASGVRLAAQKALDAKIPDPRNRQDLFKRILRGLPEWLIHDSDVKVWVVGKLHDPNTVARLIDDQDHNDTIRQSARKRFEFLVPDPKQREDILRRFYTTNALGQRVPSSYHLGILADDFRALPVSELGNVLVFDRRVEVRQVAMAVLDEKAPDLKNMPNNAFKEAVQALLYNLDRDSAYPEVMDWAGKKLGWP